MALPIFHETPSSTPWQSVFFEQSVLLSQIAGRILCKLQRPPETRSQLDPSDVRPKLLGKALHNELIAFKKNLPLDMKEPNENAGALVVALKFENIKST